MLLASFIRILHAGHNGKPNLPGQERDIKSTSDYPVKFRQMLEPDAFSVPTFESISNLCDVF